MNLFFSIREQLLSSIEGLQQAEKLPVKLNTQAITVEPPRDPAHGDMATNAAMVLAKPASMKPRDVAELLAESIMSMKGVEQVEIAGPGFINLRLSPRVWQEILPVILNEGVGFGNSALGSGDKVNVEYVSANPTGPMHIGHARGAVVGDALALLLQKTGYNVTKEYYINDAGAQVDVLAESAYLRYREALGEEIGEIPEGLYPGDYLVQVGESFAQVHGDKFRGAPKEKWLPAIRDFALEAMMVLIKNDLLEMKIEHDVFASEWQMTQAGMVDSAFETLEKKGLIYTGVLPPPKGKENEEWEAREQVLFRSTDFGDDVDRALKKSDGSWTYFAPDIAYHYDKFKRGHTKMVNIFGADHGGYVKRLKAAVNAMTSGEAKLDVLLCQLVNFMEDGQPMKMSKRAGTFTTVRDVVEAVGSDVVRFIMLTRKNDAVLDFDLMKVTEQSKDNPVFYVQYAHARCKSVLRHAAQEMMEAYELSKRPDGELLQLLDTSDELVIIKRMAEWPRVVEAAAAALEPHRIAYYLQELAATFHGLWNKGNDDAQLRFLLPENTQLTAARLALLRGLTMVIASGLQVLGVEPVEEMR